ncbi:MAG: TraB/GumN family protein [Idiomarina sp.]|nr:TraB/GumN family protein [Idiomarina sp.]
MYGVKRWFGLWVLVTGLLVLATPVQASAPVWKVSNDQHTLFIGGTVHLLPASEFPLNPAFELAYEQTDAIVLEIDMPEDPAALQPYMMQLLYQDGRTIQSVLQGETTKRLGDALGEYGIPLNMVESFRPGFFMMQLTALELAKHEMAGDGVDAYFAQRARADNKPIHSLETIEFQMGMFRDMGEGQEDLFVSVMLDQMEELIPVMNQTLEYWRVGDMDALSTLVVEPVLEEDPATYDMMFKQRNHDWIPQIEAMFAQQKNVFILVGAGHLAGPDSVLLLLEQAGYTVEAFTPSS